MRFLLVLLFFVVVLIPLFECYRFVRQSPYRYRYRVERSVPNEEKHYRVARNVGSSGYRVVPAYRYRIHRSIDTDNNSNENESPEIIIETPDQQNPDFSGNNEGKAYRFHINEAAENPKPASNETPSDCTNGDQKVC
uniref:Uncharacterized protein n=1 Tax=Panagrolaimus sp. ES5 TaxID=591445 RepID=A0AC34GV01_9BILA